MSGTRSSFRLALFLALLPLLVHLPAFCLGLRDDPLLLVSGLTEGTWHTNGWLPGYPWVDANAGVTTEAVGRFAARAWFSGRVPWWNPYAGVGLPVVAEGQTPALFLPFVLLLALPHGLLVLRCVLMAVAGLAAFALLRRLCLGATAAFLGAALFELNGTFAWVAHGPALPVAFLPLILLGLEQARGAFSVALPAGVAWSFLAGFPETAALNLLFAGVWGAVRLAQAERRAAYAVRTFLGVAAGLMIAVPAIWPFIQALPFEFLGRHGAAEHDALAPANFALLLFPYIYGGVMQTALAGTDAAGVWQRVGGYVDVVLLTFAALALRPASRDGALRWALAGWIAVTFARAAGWPPAVAVFSALPLLGQAAVHDYVLPSWSMAAAVLAAFAVQDWRDGVRLSVWRAAGLACVCAAAALMLAAPEWRPAVVFISIAAAAAALVCLHGPASPARVAGLTMTVLGYATALAALPTFAGTRGRVLDEGGVRFLQQHAANARIVSFGPLVPNYGSMFGLAEINHNALPVPSAWVAAVQARLDRHSDGINFYRGDKPDPATLSAALPALKSMGVRYLLTWPGETIPQANLAYTGRIMSTWELPAAAPYAEARGCTLHGGRLVFLADCAAPSLLLRRELFFPGWRATINGADTPITSVDKLFQQIALPAGHSEIRFTYAPPGAGWAGFASLLGFLVVVGAAGRKRFFFEKKNRGFNSETHKGLSRPAGR